MPIGLTDAQYALVQKFAKEKGFSKSAIFVLALEEYARKESGQKNKQKSIFVTGRNFCLRVLLIKAIIAMATHDYP